MIEVLYCDHMDGKKLGYAYFETFLELSDVAMGEWLKRRIAIVRIRLMFDIVSDQ